ncbi:hypothetical protein M3M39_05115 [Fructilactobacillus hinvesii]|uniref:Uncharacterized protein n=1 Tax=Fructilactobacillus hinvesii TaxID=2940300 RepID=A0ABY5BQU8_9LACO|nr:hypothetical protein [Fructilactobacillus hinvesii]USS87504.1 hypothetical protein M3M39_05115 [Fructilactobacillus hinvesii]
MAQNGVPQLKLLDKQNRHLDGEVSTDDTMKSQSSDGGDGTMKKDYVTHEELNHAVDNLSNEIKLSHKDMEMGFSNIDSKIDSKFEQINTKFEQQKVWILTSAFSVITLICTIVGLLIKIL